MLPSRCSLYLVLCILSGSGISPETCGVEATSHGSARTPSPIYCCGGPGAEASGCLERKLLGCGGGCRMWVATG
ncbi:hypothetical protein EDB85DRAFT_2040947, partial [Lactarius pseudohatsudake]